MAVAVILAALLRRAGTGPGADRVLARSRAAREMGNHLPAELTTALFSVWQTQRERDWNR
jgi:hypothetical protein